MRHLPTVLIAFAPFVVRAAEDVAVAAPLTPERVLADMARVADWQIAHPGKWPATDWTQGAWYAGLAALADTHPDSRYREALIGFGTKTGWKPGPHRYFADDHTVGQMYAELSLRFHDPAMLGPIRARFDDILANPPADETNLKFSENGKWVKGNIEKWTWCDSLFMGPPAWLRVYEATGDTRYLDFANERWWRTYDYLYDKSERLYFRDSSYFEKREANGKKVFWGRGNGWVAGGLARVLQVLPANHKDRSRYERLFRELCGRLLELQGSDGLWRASLLDPESYPKPETSSTGFNTFAFAWGVNAGLLDAKVFGPASVKGWNGLLRHVTPDGMVGSCQPVGADPKRIKETDTDVYGPGAFLLAGAEVRKALLLAANAHGTVTVDNSDGPFLNHHTVTVPAAKLRELTGTDDPSQVFVYDAAVARMRDTQPVGDSLIFQVTVPAGDTRRYLIVRKPAGLETPKPVVFAHARFVPERFDDFAWENDLTAHRVYGPALLKGEHSEISGVDVWLKSVAHPVVDARYKKNDYHRDHGDGMDCYSVGRSRGCGGDAVLADGKWWPAGNYASWKLLADGPIRASFELTYGPFDVAGKKIVEKKIFTLDAGTPFTRVDTTFIGSETPLTVGTGVVRADWKGRTGHSPAPFALDAKPDGDAGPVAHADDFVADWQSNGGKNGANGFTGVAVVVPSGAKFIPAEGHWFLATDVKPGATATAYLGATWSKAPAFPTKESWSRAVEGFAKAKAPVVTFSR